LHDRDEALGAEEGHLAGRRAPGFATLGAVRVPAPVLVLASFQSAPMGQVTVLTFLAGLAMLISSIWALR
jgi:hypothetical protein